MLFYIGSVVFGIIGFVIGAMSGNEGVMCFCGYMGFMLPSSIAFLGMQEDINQLKKENKELLSLLRTNNVDTKGEESA